MANVIIGVILTKGGVSKTTTSVGLAEAATLGGGPVTVIDADPMGGAVRWAQLAEAAGRPLRATVVGMPVQDIPRRIHPIARESSVVVIDAPPPGPGAAAIAEAAIAASDLVVMPIPPRPGDVDRVRVTKEVADRHGKPSRAVLTQVRGGQKAERRLDRVLELLEQWDVSVYKTQFPYSAAVEASYGQYLMRSNPVMRYGMELMTEILTTEIGKVNHG